MQIVLRKATDLSEKHITTAAIIKEFKKKNYPLFYNSYSTEKSFIALPLSLLKELAESANNKQLLELLENAEESLLDEAEKFRMKLSKNYWRRRKDSQKEKIHILETNLA